MHGPTDAWSLWQAWRRIEEERAGMLSELDSVSGGDSVAVPDVLWGRHRYTSVDEILSAPAPGWARLDAAAMRRHLDRAATLAAELEAAQAPHRAALAAAPAARAQRLADEANRLAAAIRRAPITTPADVLARLDLIAAMWGPAGEISEPGAPLAELLVLIEALSRCAPGFVPTWTRRRPVVD